MVSNYKIDSQFHGEITCSLVGNKIKVHTVAMQERHCVGIYFWHRKKRVNRIPKVDTCSYSAKMHKLRNLSCHKKEVNNKRWMNQSNIPTWTALDQCASNLAPGHSTAKSRWRYGQITLEERGRTHAPQVWARYQVALSRMGCASTNLNRHREPKSIFDPPTDPNMRKNMC
jgi:hypothetical protein